MQHLPLGQRLCSAALVCSDWAKAAALATVQVQHKPRQATVPPLEAWFEQYGGQLETLALKVPQRPGYSPEPTVHLRLPWARLSSLQRLVLHGCQSAVSSTAAASQEQASSSSGGPPAPLLPQLQHFEIRNASFSVQELLQLIPSQHLTCLVVDRLSTTAGADDDAAVGAAALLSAVRQLPKLECLHLAGNALILARLTQTRRRPTDADYAALTAPAQLTKLVLAAANGLLPVPHSALEHIFPASAAEDDDDDGKQLPALREVAIAAQSKPRDDGWWFLRGPDVARIIRCCPAHEALDISHAVRTDADLTPLLQLPKSCRKMSIAGGQLTDAAAASVVAKLTHLTSLSWLDSRAVTDLGVFELTTLRRLDWLSMTGCGFSLDMCWDDDEGQEMSIKSYERHNGGQVPVWEQLKDRCDGSKICTRARLQQKQEVIDEQQELLERQQEVLQGQFQEIQEQARVIEGLRQQLAAAQAQLLAAQQAGAATAGQG